MERKVPVKLREPVLDVLVSSHKWAVALIPRVVWAGVQLLEFSEGVCPVDGIGGKEKQRLYFSFFFFFITNHLEQEGPNQ